MQNLCDVLASPPPEADVIDRIALQRVGPVAVITLSAPAQRNALTLAAWRRIGSLMSDLRMDQGVRLVLLRGAGGHFGAGADIKEFGEVRMTAADAVTYNETLARAIRAVGEHPVPVVAMIEGLAVGGGLELSSAADFRIGARSTRVGLPIGRLGVGLGLTETRSLLRLVGPAALKYIVFSGQLIDAEAAARMGILQAVHDDDRIVDETVVLAEAIVASSVPTIRAVKEVAEMAQRPVTDADTEVLVRHALEIYSGPDLAEGVAAFVAGRPASFPSTHPDQGATS